MSKLQKTVRILNNQQRKAMKTKRNLRTRITSFPKARRANRNLPSKKMKNRMAHPSRSPTKSNRFLLFRKSNASEKINIQHIMEIRDAFELADQDKEGSLDEEEFINAF